MADKTRPPEKVPPQCINEYRWRYLPGGMGLAQVFATQHSHEGIVVCPDWQTAEWVADALTNLETGGAVDEALYPERDRLIELGVDECMLDSPARALQAVIAQLAKVTKQLEAQSHATNIALFEQPRPINLSNGTSPADTEKN